MHSLFRRWQRAGVWQRIVTALRAGADAVGLIGWEVSVDSTVARAHQHAAGPAPGRTGRRNLRVESATERAASPLITRWDVRAAG
jgi:transposase